MEKLRIVPKPIIKYKFETIKHLNKIECPIYVIHGDHDNVIPVSHSIRLKEQFKKIDLTILQGYGHNNISSSELYKSKTVEILK